MTTARLAGLVPLALTALGCSSADGVTDGGVLRDVAVTDGGACHGTPLPPHAAPTRLLAVGSNYVAGTVALIDPVTLAVTPRVVEASGDTVARSLGTTLVMLDRAGAVGRDSLTFYDLGRSPPGFLEQVPAVTDAERAVRPAAPLGNPHDVLAVSARKVYVARYGQPSLGIVDLDARQLTDRAIDLTVFVGTAMLPEPDALALVNVVNCEAWVTLERLDASFHARQPGAIAVIDPATDRVVDVDPATAGVQPVLLHHGNPLGPILTAPDGRMRWVATFGLYEVVGDGAVEEIDPATHAWVRDVVTEAEVQGNIDGAVVLDARRLLLRVSGARTGNGDLAGVRLVAWDTVARAATTWATFSTWTAALPVVSPDGARVFVPDRGDPAMHTPGGIRVFDGAGREVGPTVPLGMPPYDLQLVP